MARKKTYSKSTLKKAVTAYFDSITRKVTIQEKVDSGKRDSYGHIVWELKDVVNSLGEVATRIEFLVPPTIGGLCVHLGINSSTWSRWRDVEEFREIIELVYDRLITWRQEQVVTRDKVAGIIWDLETNYGCGKEQKEKNPEVSVVIEGGDPAWRS